MVIPDGDQHYEESSIDIKEWDSKGCFGYGAQGSPSEEVTSEPKNRELVKAKTKDSDPGRWTSGCKGPEAGLEPVCLRNSHEARLARVE